MLGEVTTNITKDEKSSWTCVVWPNSVASLNTGKPVSVRVRVAELEFDATLMPIGGQHMVPLRKEILRKLGVQLGDLVTVKILAVNPKTRG